jgi:arsenate reductase
MLTIYHNNRCGKSRSALCILEETGKLFRTVEYLKDVPTIEEFEKHH